MSARTAPVSTVTTFGPAARAAVEPDGPRVGRRAWFALAVLMLPVLLVSVDNTVLNFALPLIAEDLGPSGTELLWIVDAYPLVLAGLLVAMGSLGDRVGRRKLLLIGAVGFAVVSVAAAFAPTAGALIAARAALGLFGATLMPSTLSLLRSLFPNRDQRRMAIAIWATGFAVGSAVGPLVGGVLLENFAWGSVFLLAVPVLLPLVVLAPILVPESRDPKPGPVDVVSIVLSLATMAPIVYAIKSAAEHGIDAVAVLSLVVGVVSGVLFVRRQQRREVPMLDLSLFRRGSFSAAILVNLLSVVALVGGLFFVSQHLQLVVGLSPLEAGLVLVPGLVVMIGAGLGVVPIARRISPRIVVPAGLVISAVGYALLAIGSAAPGGASALTVAISFAFLGLGIGAAETVSNELVLANAPADKAGSASAVSETAYELGAVLGTATLGTVLTAAYRSGVVLPEGLDAGQAQRAGETLGGAVAVAGEIPAESASSLLASAGAAFDAGVGWSAWIGVGLVLLAGVVAAWRLRRS
ncbi:MFS transporter [Rathayibacter sp. VKM Ac-2929]|uniref:MFS transporter n=1 Tax=Rathayibacter sp. VKM Ac-2929 TaxID=2929480 RepID=UPI001FB3B4DF|nr:MFS transporter [Rathayibacter sp. VKM Ac-2929]MCJ1672377.1 MFS transporter [Rathayibacter sp. VKM Ac-2929]